MATIIDALVMTLGLDASDYQKNSQKVKKDTQSLTDEQKKQLDKVERQAKQALNAVASVQKGIIGMFAAVAGATGIAQFLSQVNQAEAALGRLSSHTGQSTQDLQKWGNMAALVGGSAEDMQAGMSNLQQQLTDLKYKGEMGGTVTFLAQMGVAVANTNGEMRKQSDIMLDLSDRAKGMKKEDFYNLASSSGMTDSQIDVIMKGRTELEKMLIAQEENALVTKEQAEEARKLQAEWELMKQSIFSAGVRILHDLMPIIQAVAEGLRKFFNFLQKHRGIIYGFFIVLAAVMLPVLITTTAIVAQFLLMAAPIIAVSAAIGLLIDDFITWKEGGESLFGTFCDWFDKLIDKVAGFGDLLRAIFTGDWVKVAQIAKSYLIDDEPEKSDGKTKTEKSKGIAQTIKEGAEAVGTMIVGSLKMGGEVQEGMQSGGMSSNGKVLSLTEQDIVDIMKVASTEVVPSLSGKSFEMQAAGVIDTILNRVASGKYGKGVRGVANQRWAFSDINTPRKSAYGSVQNVPMSRVSGRMEQFVREYLEKRASGLNSSVGGNLNYANPYYLGEAKPDTIAWVREAEAQAKKTGQIFGSGKAIHVHGTPSSDKSKIPKPFAIQTPKSIKTPPISNSGQAALSGNTTSMSNTTVETHIGEVKVYTAATDAQGIANGMKEAIGYAYNTYAFDSGLT